MWVADAYAKEFLTSEVKRGFEQALADAKHSFPKVQWIRLDHMKELNANEYFWDLVHMNGLGQKIATKEFLHQYMDLKRIQ